MSWLEYLIVSYIPLPPSLPSFLLVWTWFYGPYKVVYTPLKRRCFVSDDEVGISTFYNWAECDSSLGTVAWCWSKLQLLFLNHALTFSERNHHRPPLPPPLATTGNYCTGYSTSVHYISVRTFSEFWNTKGTWRNLKWAVMFIIICGIVGPAQTWVWCLNKRPRISFSTCFRISLVYFSSYPLPF
jgi:hypothetical protein